MLQKCFFTELAVWTVRYAESIFFKLESNPWFLTFKTIIYWVWFFQGFIFEQSCKYFIILAYLSHIWALWFCCPSYNSRYSESCLTGIHKVCWIHLSCQGLNILQDSNFHLRNEKGFVHLIGWQRWIYPIINRYHHRLTRPMSHGEKTSLWHVSMSCFKNQEKLPTQDKFSVLSLEWYNRTGLKYICLLVHSHKQISTPLHCFHWQLLFQMPKHRLFVSNQMPDTGVSKKPKFGRLKKEHSFAILYSPVSGR